MCGRNSLFIDQVDLEDRFDAEVVTDGGYTPRYDIAPGDDLHVITNEAPDEIDRYPVRLDPARGRGAGRRAGDDPRPGRSPPDGRGDGRQRAGP